MSDKDTQCSGICERISNELFSVESRHCCGAMNHGSHFICAQTWRRLDAGVNHPAHRPAVTEITGLCLWQESLWDRIIYFIHTRQAPFPLTLCRTPCFLANFLRKNKIYFRNDNILARVYVSSTDPDSKNMI